MVSLLMLMIMTAMLQETGPDFVIGTMEEFLTGSKYCDLAFICDNNLVCDMTRPDGYHDHDIMT